MLRNNTQRTKGDVFITSLIFLFVLIGTLHLCCTKTLHEAKLSTIFVQETQGFYLLENLMYLARDYAYQIVQNPREPHLFLSASAYRLKERLGNPSEYVVDFNGSLSKQQIVPDDFSLQIDGDDHYWAVDAKKGWEIKGGPIFWKDIKKNNNDERYLAEVFMLGSLKLKSKFIPDWTMRTVQTMEIERNPLCDFQLYAEGDITLNSDIHPAIDTNFKGPVQINGNAILNFRNGDNDSDIIFHNKLNCAGYTLRSAYPEDFLLPQKYHMCSTRDAMYYDSGHTDFVKTVGIGRDYFSFRMSPTLDISLNLANNEFGGSSYTSTYDSYERYWFYRLRGKCSTRSRIYRPIGFDPANYWGYWDPSSASQPAVTAVVDKIEQSLNYGLGFHNLAQSSVKGGYEIGSGDFNQLNALTRLRGLNNYQRVEKARLAEMQKPINFPSAIIKVITDSTKKNSSTLYVPNNFIFSTYMNNAFPAYKDNIYINRYLTLAFQNSSVVTESYANRISFNTTNSPEYAYDYSSTTFMVGKRMYMNIKNNKSSFATVNEPGSISEINTTSMGITTLKSKFSPSSHSDDSCPPHKISNTGDHWTLDYYVTRLSGEHYNFLYDRNRAKWIQVVDIDVGKLTDKLNSYFNSQTSIEPIVCINSAWQGNDAKQSNKNYRYKGHDIRDNYAADRANFFENYQSGNYVYPTANPVIDIGVRLINATRLPDKGLTFYSPYPLYIKGNFNTSNTKPALIVTDSLTILPNTWQDWRSQMDPINSYLWYNGSSYVAHPNNHNITIHADIITGRTHPHFWLKGADTTTSTNQTEIPNPDMGWHDAIRTLCDFGQPIKLYGSLMIPYFCQEQWEPPIDFCKTASSRNPYNYAYPPIELHLRDDVKIPAAMPFYYRINRGRKTHCLGNNAYNALSGSTLYGKDWNSQSFSSYHSALPNYLKYEVNP